MRELTDAERDFVSRHLYLVNATIMRLGLPAGADRADLRDLMMDELFKGAMHWRPGALSARSYLIQRFRWAAMHYFRTLPGGSRATIPHFPLSLDAPITHAQGRPLALQDMRLSDVLSSGDDATPDDARTLAVRAAISRLPERMRTVLARRMVGETFDSIGADFGVTGSRIKQIEKQAVRHLRRQLRFWGAPSTPPARGWDN